MFTGSFNNEKVKGQGFTDENTEIIINDFAGNWEGIQLNGKKISVNNLVTPYIDLAMQSTADFSTLNNKIGLRTIELVKGKASLNLQYAGLIPEDLSILDKLEGKLNFSNGTINYLPRNFTFNNCSGSILFSGSNIKVDDLQCDLGRNHFKVNVTGTNLGGLSATNNSEATISCSVYSPALNIADFKALFSRKKAKATYTGKMKNIINMASGIDDVMDHGNLNVSINAGSVYYNNFTGKNLTGNILFSNNNLKISGVSLQHANGKLMLNADITQNATNHSASAKAVLANVDVSKVFQSFDNFGQDGISGQNLKGTLNTNADVKLLIDNTGSIVPGSMNGIVDFSLNKGALINYEPLENMKNFIFKNKDMSHVYFAELKNKLEISNYKIKINRMEIQSSAIAMFVEGIYDIKKVDSKISIQVPLKGLKQRDSTFIPKNIGVNAKAGTSVYLEGKNDKTGKVKFGLNTTKTLRKLF